ncbi:MAG: hypothetical protein HY898_13715 [Deltaproteobacteria bacterium]|nr:hypothetical protein [Deltaproteobacteria bacterium]
MATASVAANLATHVTIHVVVPRLGLPLPAWDLVGEAFAFAVEAAVYAIVIRPRSAWWAVAASALANGVSYTAGLVLLAG